MTKTIHIGPFKISSSRTWDALILVTLSFVITAIMVLYTDFLPSNIQVGNIALRDIKADQNYELVDVSSTEKFKNDAAASVMPVYDFDSGLVAARIKKIEESFGAARQRIADAKSPGGKALFGEEEDKLRQDFQITLGIALADPDYSLIRGAGFSEDLEQALVTMLEPVQKQPIVEDKAEMLSRGAKGIAWRTLDPVNPVPVETNLYEYSGILSRKEAQGFYEGRGVAELQKQLHLDFIDSDDIKTAKVLFPQFIKADVDLDKVETDARRDRARSNIQNIIYKLQKGQMIIRRGDRYEPWHLTVIDGMRNARLNTNVIAQFVGMFCLILIAILSVFYFGRWHVLRFRPTRRDMALLGLVLAGSMAMLRFGSFTATSLKDAMPFAADITTFYYFFPIAAGAMIVRYILNAETALLFSILLCSFAGIFLENNLEITVYYLISSIVAAHLIGAVERRSAVFRCGVSIGLVNAAVVACLNLVSIIAISTTVDFSTLTINCLFAFAGGLMNALVMLAVSPILETLFNYTTNIQLLELANMNHPLLREMIVRAPGTYHHSQLVGILAEAGARAIGANYLLARVSSYYHDIGKMKKPQYFIENQKGDNPHDRLAPSMSALIIEAHVKDGIEMAKEYNLPKVITDFIPEHQGTKLIGYFYNKAKKLADESTRVDERDFRYKGPRPQSREAGIVMLSDTIEAAVRSMPEKAPQKIQAMVEKLVNMHFVDGQLNECDLTLRDLHLIVEAFVKILIGIYHQRVEYPEQHYKTPIKLVKSDANEDSEHPYHKHPSASENVSPLFKDKHL